jgi:hypothetical protein
MDGHAPAGLLAGEERLRHGPHTAAAHPDARVVPSVVVVEARVPRPHECRRAGIDRFLLFTQLPQEPVQDSVEELEPWSIAADAVLPLVRSPELGEQRRQERVHILGHVEVRLGAVEEQPRPRARALRVVVLGPDPAHEEEVRQHPCQRVLPLRVTSLDLAHGAVHERTRAVFADDSHVVLEHQGARLPHGCRRLVLVR